MTNRDALKLRDGTFSGRCHLYLVLSYINLQCNSLVRNLRMILRNKKKKRKTKKKKTTGSALEFSGFNFIFRKTIKTK